VEYRYEIPGVSYSLINAEDSLRGPHRDTGFFRTPVLMLDRFTYMYSGDLVRRARAHRTDSEMKIHDRFISTSTEYRRFNYLRISEFQYLTVPA
jgi:hypothetical protein